MSKTAIVIGAGFSGLSAAAYLSKAGYKTLILEKHDTHGGRARVFFKDGFKFDMGPSWYWMPEVIEKFFIDHGSSSSAFFDLLRLSPSYSVIFGKDDVWQIPSSYAELAELFEKIEPGSAEKLDAFLREAKVKYDAAMNGFVYKPSIGISEFLDARLLKAAFSLNLFRSHAAHIRKYFSNPRLLQILEFPVLFLGGLPENIPALYSLMNYADMKLGTWYPMGGFGKLADAMAEICKSNGVEIRYNCEVSRFLIENDKIRSVVTSAGSYEADVVISSADYHFTEQLLPRELRNYSSSYWNTRTMAPSCLLFYIGVSKKLSRLQHHNLFFENGFADHAAAIYTNPGWPKKPLYYVCCSSKTDPGSAPPGMENLFILIPVAAGLKDSPEIHEKYFKETILRLQEYCGENIEGSIVSKTTYGASNFLSDYNAFKGNAYGLANTLWQTAFLKPSIKNNKLNNLYYTGQLTVPGPGVPPSIISGQIVADYVIKRHKKAKQPA